MIRQFEFELEKAEHGMAHPITPSALISKLPSSDRDRWPWRWPLAPPAPSASPLDAFARPRQRQHASRDTRAATLAACAKGGLVRIIPTRGGPRLHNLIRFFQPFRGHRHNQTTQERPLIFVFVSRIGIRFAFHTRLSNSGVVESLLPPRASFQREAPHGSSDREPWKTAPLW